MRTDVKLGVVLALVMVLTAGGYFMFRGERQKPISLADTAKDAASNSNAPAAKPGSATKPSLTNTPRPAANPPARTATNPRLQPNAANRPTSPVTSPTGITGTPATPTRPAIGAPLENKPSTASTSNPNPTVTASTPGSASTVPSSAGPEVKTVPVTGTSPMTPTTTPGPALATAPTTTIASPGPTITGSTLGLTGIPNPSSPTTPQPQPNPSTTLASNSNPASSPSGMNLPPGIRPNSTPGTSPAPTRIETADAAVDTHKVQAGDTLTSLAQTYYGDTRHARFLAESNPKLSDPNRLRIGTLVRIPPLPAGTESRMVTGPSAPAGSIEKAADGKRTYTVKSGDSFYSIAKSQLGNASRWKELLAINNSVVNGDPTSLQPGQRLVLPES